MSSRKAPTTAAQRRLTLERDALHLAAIVDSSDDAIVSKDLDGIVKSWNRAAERLFGYAADEIIGRSIRVIVPADRQSEEDQVLATIRRGESVDHFETIRVRKDGTLIPISLTVSPIRSVAGEIVGASKIARDITERKRADEERQRLLGLARDASRLKDEFLATLSHELRTPLNAILGYLRMMQAGLLSGEKQTRAIETVLRNATSLGQIVEDVLDVSRIISGKLRLEMQPVDVSEIVHEAVDTVRPAADAKGIRIDTIEEGPTSSISGDPERLRQVIWNLCANAVKFTGPGGRVAVRIQAIGPIVRISVTDTGIGIPVSFLPYVFERFRQADASLDRVHGGLGLGLAISRHLVEMQGGRIFAESEGAGKGSTFRVELPLGVRAAPHPSGPDDAADERPKRAATIVVPALDGVKVLAVDDDRDALALVREILEATGATIVTADSGEDALEKFERTRPDVLLADLAMPHMNGFELIARVRSSKAGRETPAGAMTAFARSEDRLKALRSGFQLHLSKPIDPGDLMAAVATLAGRPGPDDPAS